MASEFVSCILPTCDRPHFFQQALRCFQRQTYRDSELIVVDDGAAPVGEFCAGLDRVRYLRLDTPTLTGAKLNLGVEQARGRVIQKLDDDDYYHPDFLKLAVSNLPARGRKRCLVAWDCFVVLFAGCRRVHASGHGWTAGGTFCFWRNLWEAGRFREVPRAVDHWLLIDHQPRVVRVCAPEHYILVRHGRNTWTRMEGADTADDYLRRLPLYPKPLRALVDPRDVGFYASLKPGK